MSLVRVSRAEFEAFLATPHEGNYDLIHGEIVPHLHTQLRGYIIGQLAGVLGLYLRDYPLGYGLISADYALPDDPYNWRTPPLSFIFSNRGKLNATGAAPYMPDLVADVCEFGQSDNFMADKAAYYLAHGTKMVWLIYPDRRLVEVLTPIDRQLLTDSAILTGGDVLPGLEIAIHEIFPSDEVVG
ncbi:MAG: Uma2 family endonuclease [Phototrophicaceae bacterium]|jgi:Uma2 family endonuclease